MEIRTIIFKREKDSDVEVGIEIAGSVIIDINKKLVPRPTWDFRRVIGIELDVMPILKELSTIKWNL